MEDKTEKDISYDFLKAKFGSMTCKYHCYEDESHNQGDLVELLDEFKAVVLGRNLVEVKNPRTKEYTLVDRHKGIVIGSYKGSILNPNKNKKT